MSDDHDTPKDCEELESLLKRLVPSCLEEAQVSKLSRIQERLTAERLVQQAEMPWSRVVPLLLLSLAVMSVFAFQRYRSVFVSETSTELAESATLATDDAARTPPPLAAEPVATPASHFIPVSAHGTIVNTSSEGIIETETGPLQKLNIEYRDAYHWHDPESGTNIRYFRPRMEEVIVPFQSD